MKKSENKISLDATTTTGYSAVWSGARAQAGSIHWEVDETSATFACTVTVWASNKDDPDTTDDTDWVDISSDVTQPVVTGGDTKGIMKLIDGNAIYEWVRIKYVRTGGEGGIRHWASAKDNV